MGWGLRLGLELSWVGVGVVVQLGDEVSVGVGPIVGVIQTN